MSDYLHGYNHIETERLGSQASTLENMIYTGLDFSVCTNMLEIGCGTGEQTRILLKNNPNLFLTSIDISISQIELAKENLINDPTLRDRVQFIHVDAGKLPFEPNQFDSVFICWVLEHTSKPKDVLAEARRVLKPGGAIFLTEVYNSALNISPECPAIKAYWSAFNQLQNELGGDADVGMKLGKYLAETGFEQITTTPLFQHHDKRDIEQKKRFLDYWLELMLSASDNLLAHHKIEANLIEDVKKEFDDLKSNDEAIFYYSPIRGHAVKPATV